MTIAQPSQAAHEPTVHDVLPQLRAASLRMLTAVLRLSDAELALPARSSLGTRRHVVARMTRRADRTTRVLDGVADGPEPADQLLDMPAGDLMAALTAALGGVLGALTEHASGTRAASDEARAAAVHACEHLAWLELSHVDLDAGYDMHDVPDASLDAIAAHFRAARASDGASSPFAPLMSS
ncbi:MULTISPECIES: hypothetical protein [unclassified Agrococcus]|uniref:hypothetical protein n=1 Tax=unclassified Agrococcus TaxID=2615065 RepID=UPI00362124BB